MNTLTYSYGHTKESAALVREALKTNIKEDIRRYNLKISVRKADSGYGGPRVNITTPHIELDKCYKYIIDENGNPVDCGTLVIRPVSSIPMGRPHYTAQLVTPEALEQLNERINKVLRQFGHDNDDAMTDYFDNTMPLFYGVKFEA